MTLLIMSSQSLNLKPLSPTQVERELKALGHFYNREPFDALTTDKFEVATELIYARRRLWG